MKEKMLKFVEIGQQSPPKRDKEESESKQTEAKTEQTEKGTNQN